MLRIVTISVIRGLLTLIGVSLITFILARLNGNPLLVLLPDTATAADRAAMAQLWGLDKPEWQQYLIYLNNAIHGNFGTSFKWSGEAVTTVILDRLPATLQLSVPSLIISTALAVPLGVLAGTHRGSWIDHCARILAMLGQSLPGFWVAIMLIWLFSVQLGWLPTSGIGGVDHMILPIASTAFLGLAALVRLIRSSMLEVLDSEYIKLARLKGLSEFKVIWKHALKNAAIPPITLFGTVLVSLITGSVITEQIFSWPGVGLLALDATNARDYPVIQGLVLMGSVGFVVVNLAIDLVYAWIDPRVHLGR